MQWNKRLKLSLAAIGMMSVMTGAVAEISPVIRVDAAKSLGPVNRLVFGHNMEAADARGLFSEPFDAVKCKDNGIKYGQWFWDPATRAPFAEPLAELKKIKAGMMRYPGGCLAHNFNWKKAVGPLKERGDWQFGIDEYIKFCRAMNAEPMITVTDYALPAAELPQHCAELVEYLNAPATPEHPWAMKRKEWGNPEPYNVVWFELGNETDHGNHKCVPGRRYMPEEYVKYVGSVAAAMKKVDPKIKLGVVTVPGAGDDYGCEWNKAIYKGAAPVADYVVVHFYGPGIDGFNAKDGLKAAMAYSSQLEYRLGKYHELITAGSGRDLPLAVTEFNINAARDLRVNYTAGLMCADFMRVWLRPENKIVTASYWHIMNGVYGAFNSAEGKIAGRFATLPFFELWGAHFGTKMIASEVIGSPVGESQSVKGLDASCGTKMTSGKTLATMPCDAFDLAALRKEGLTADLSGDGVLRIKIDNKEKDFYVPFLVVKRPDESVVKSQLNFTYKLSFEARYLPQTGTAAVGLGMGDVRGWVKTHSAMAVSGIQNARDWQKFEKDYAVLPDCPGAAILARLENVSGKVSGTLEIRNLKIDVASSPIFPAYPTLTTCSSISDDGKTLYLMVFNKSADATIVPQIELSGFDAASAKYFELYQDNVATKEYFLPTTGDISLQGNVLTHRFPPHSMTAVEVYRK